MPKFFYLSLQLSGFDISKAKTNLQEILSIPETKFENYVINKKQEILDYQIENNPNYKSFVGNTIPKNWNDLPIMIKKDFQKPLLERLSKNYNLKNVYVNKTSGSSGDPFVFAKDKYCHTMTWANIINRFSWFGIDFNSSLQARFYGIPLDFIGNKKERLKDFLSNRYRFTIFDLSDVFLEKVLVKFQSKKFDYINGYTSSIVLFAKFLEQKKIVLNQVCPSLKCCVVTSEMLFDADKLLMEQQFGVPIINEYGASELDIIAFQNPDGDWQVNSETLFVEILDDNNNVLENGNEGRIVLTSLFNKAHPFIRYD
ncbi:MAG: phenylacetate--CoA ligase family protein, partial [Flavobacterium sp.]|nr:phenylacetate--CoA ligase family protein [Flavobacterium sp.]